MLSNTKVDDQEPLDWPMLAYRAMQPVLIYNKENGLLVYNDQAVYAIYEIGGNRIVELFPSKEELNYDKFDFYAPYQECETCHTKWDANKGFHICESNTGGYEEFEDLDIVINALGGAQSALRYDFTEFEPEFLFRVAAVLKQGKDKYGHKNWTKIPFEDHINHAFYHLVKAETDDNTEDHLANATCRIMFAMHMKSQSQQDQSQEHHQ